MFRHLDSLEKSDGLYPLYVNRGSGEFSGREVSFGALGDSFYEYMLKLWLFTGKEADGYRRMYEESSTGAINRLVQTSKSGYRYLAQMGKGGGITTKMEHLVSVFLFFVDFCSLGGSDLLCWWNVCIRSCE